MSIGDYALLSNLRCAALVSRAGAVEWFCPGRFDRPACFAALLGTSEHGVWRIAPQAQKVSIERHYRKDSLVLETCFTTPEGKVTVVDTMPLTDEGCHILRLVEGVSGEVPMEMSCSPRFEYGRLAPAIEQYDDGKAVRFSEGDTQLRLITDGILEPQSSEEPNCAVSRFTLSEGEQRWFVLTSGTPGEAFPDVPEIRQSIAACTEWWREWVSHCTYRGRWEEEVKQSLIVLKAMTYYPAGGMVAAVTTSLPEVPGGEANYDYRFCWIRDAAFALKVLLNAGYREEACSWRDWLLKAVNQHEQYMHALYCVDGTVAPEERELDWLPGHLNSRPVRAGNAASDQYQLDLRGELMEVFHLARDYGLEWDDDIWQLQCQILEQLEGRWQEPDEGMWEFRTLYDHLTHSKVLCWAAFDRCIRDAEKYGFDAPVEHWRKVREQIRADVLERGVHPEGGYFTQRYGSDNVDASLLMIPLVGFLPADDPRMKATIAAIEKELCTDGLVERYRVGDQAEKEGKFLPCCFWLADNYWLAGRHEEAESLFTRLLEMRNDVGLLSEEWDHHEHRLLGNFPQGLSHLALISAAQLIATGRQSYTSLT